MKEITDDNLKLLKESIIKYGFSFPVFVWGDKIIDGHHRIKAVKSMLMDGYVMKNDSVPVVNIDAENEKEVAEKLLVLNSQYAKITPSGLENYLDNFGIDINTMPIDIKIPELDDIENKDIDIEDNTIYEIVIEANSEEEQENIFNKLKKLRYKCRILTL